uniref:Secreted protein n=2 Tax=Physcomitrium patens TaxID=3218 RepID=A0A2K1KCZ1_PHYPA|nr:hypothetical protein PHYPA_010830 [Physcomitrium patens]
MFLFFFFFFFFCLLCLHWCIGCTMLSSGGFYLVLFKVGVSGNVISSVGVIGENADDSSVGCVVDKVGPRDCTPHSDALDILRLRALW